VEQFFDFLELLFDGYSFLVGLLVASLAMGSAPVIFRARRRAQLRRNWRLDLPNFTEPGLYPEWQKYDPDMPGIDKKCICHRRLLHPGEQVMTWPETGPLTMLHVAVYCESVREKLWLAL
jgi:hypothetical protein